MDFRLPALGEGIDSATITAVLVKPGDAISNGKAVLSVETDKAAMEVEADVEGTVEQVLVKPGDKIPVGGPILKLGGMGKADGKKPAPSAEKPKAEPASSEKQKSEPAQKEEPKTATAQTSANENIEFNLPPLGEGIENATVTAVLVKPGDTVKS